MKRILPSVAIFTFAFFFFAPAASASTLHLSPGSGTVPQGGSLSVRVTLNTGGEGVNGVSAYLSYSASSVDATVSCGGAFAIGAECSAGGGSIRISRGSINPVSGNVTVGTITLKGKAQGAATVSFVGGSAAPRASDSSDSLNLGGSSGGTYTVGPPSAQPPQSQPPSAPQQATGGPNISEVAITNITKQGATIGWKTDIPSDSAVEYGLEAGKYFLSSIDENFTTDHTIKLESPLLTPGAQLHLRVVSKDAKGNKSEGTDLVLQLLGYGVTVSLYDEDGKPLSDIEVSLFSQAQTEITDENGVAVFEHVTPGRHVVIAKSDTVEKSSQIDVLDGSDKQSFSLTLSGFRKPLIDPLVALIVSYAVIMVSILVVYIVHRRRSASGL